jgi:hypothetical protein
MTTYQRLMKARLALQATKLSKSGHNKFAGYEYFELADFLPTCQKLLFDNGLAAVVSFGRELATLTVVDIEKPAENPIVFTSPMSSAALKGCHEIQNLGAVETYLRRYLYVTAFEIVEHDALDATTGNETAMPKKQTPPKPAATPAPAPVAESPADPQQIAELAAISMDTEDNKLIERALAKFNRKSITEFTKTEAARTLRFIENEKAAAKKTKETNA